MDQTQTGNARQRVLDVAEALFVERGYTAVKLRDIADMLNIQQASLYYHFPDGKEQLYVEMAQRLFVRHHKGMATAISAATVDLGAQLQAAADWFSTQPAINFLGMMYADMPALSGEHRRRLSHSAYEALFDPIQEVFREAQARGEARIVRSDLLAGFFLALLDGITFSETQQRNVPREVMVQEMIRLILDGIRPSVQSSQQEKQSD